MNEPLNEMASDVCWNNLPSVVLLEIFKRMSQEERINASATCKEWRKALFFPNFWREININFYSKNDKCAVQRCQFLKRYLMSSVRNVRITFSYQYLSLVDDLLLKLSGNRQTQKLLLFNCERPIWNPDLSCCISNLQNLIENVKALNTLWLNHCWLPILENDSLKTSLEKHKDTLKCLGLGAVYSNTSPSRIIQLPVDFAIFKRLEVLSLDHAWLTDDIINEIADIRLLKRFSVHVNEIFEGQIIKKDSWENFHQSLPECELHVNVIQGINEDVEFIFMEGMPITHVKLLYCDKVNGTLLSKLSSFKELRSVWCLAEKDDEGVTQPQNPLVMCAWACKKLEEIVICGFLVQSEDLIGIARLSRDHIKKIDICQSDIIKYCSDEVENFDSRHLSPSEMKRLKEDMSRDLNRLWVPMDMTEFKRKKLSTFENKINNIVQVLTKDLF